MNKTIRLTGIGGQGVLTAGDILIRAYLSSGGYGLKSSTYTSQVRGGPTKVDILLSDSLITYPYALSGTIDIMLSTGQRSFDLFHRDISPTGIIIIDPDLVHLDPASPPLVPPIPLPIMSLAASLGNPLTQSTLVLGLLSYLIGYEDISSLTSTMLSSLPSRLSEVNLEAFNLGISTAKSLQI